MAASIIITTKDYHHQQRFLFTCFILILLALTPAHAKDDTGAAEKEIKISESAPAPPPPPELPAAPPEPDWGAKAITSDDDNNIAPALTDQPIAKDRVNDKGMKKGADDELNHLNENIFKKIFKLRRVAHKEIMEKLLKMGKYEFQYKAIDQLAENMFQLIETHKLTLENLTALKLNNKSIILVNVSDTTVMEAMSYILENVALFSDIVYHMPDMTQRLLKTRQKWNATIHWAYDYARKSKKLLDKPTMKIINLASQELNIVERSKNYVNPHSDKYKSTNKPKKVKKEKKKREPKLTKVEL